MSSKLKFPFLDLPRKTREQLATSLNDDAFVSHTDSISDGFFYSVRGFGLLFALFLLWTLLSNDFGDPLLDSGWNDPGMLLVYLVLTGAIVYLVWSSVERRLLTKMFGFTPARYVLPFAIIDARTQTISVTDLLELARLDIVHHTSNDNYVKSVYNFSLKDGEVHQFTVKNHAVANQFQERFRVQQAATHKAFNERDLNLLRHFDPLIELRQKKWVLPTRATPVGFVRRQFQHLVRACCIITLLVAPVIWLARTSVADFAMARQAVALNNEAAYLGYLKRGYFRVTEMRAALPRVAFNEAARSNSVTALRNVLRRYPKGGLGPDVASAIHVQYQRGMEKFRAKAVQTDPALIEAMQQLLTLVETRGNPNVPIRFTRPSMEQLNDLDKSLATRGLVDGLRVIPASPHFADSSAKGREARIVQSLTKAFKKIFPHDVLMLVPGTPRDAAHPVLDIHYQIDPSGELYSSREEEKQKDRRGFVGLVMGFDAALIASDTAAKWRFKLEVKPPDHFTVANKPGSTLANGSPADGQVYAVMAERAFDSLESAITAAFFRPNSETPAPQAPKARKASTAQLSNVPP